MMTSNGENSITIDDIRDSMRTVSSTSESVTLSTPMSTRSIYDELNAFRFDEEHVHDFASLYPSTITMNLMAEFTEHGKKYLNSVYGKHVFKDFNRRTLKQILGEKI